MKKILLLFTLVGFICTYISCSKSDPAPAPNPCAGVTLTVTGTVVNTAPAASNGSITATTAGSGVTYQLNSGTFQASGTFSNLAAGTYTITAKNANGCTGSAQFTVGTLNLCAGVTVVVTAVTITPATIANNDGSIVVSATGGAGFTYSKNGGAFQASSTFGSLAAGVYVITAKNSDGCTGTASFTVTNPCTGVTVTVTTTTTPTGGAGQTNGSITATATGGAGFTYSLGGGAFQASGLFQNLAAGTYTITAKNNNGCTGSAQATVATSNPCSGVTINVTTTTTAAAQCANPANGGISVSASGGASPYMYKLDAGTQQASNLFNGLAAGNYVVTVTDANGCIGTANVVVANAAPGPLFNAVKQVLAANCALSGCHVGANPQNGLDFTNNCTIVGSSDRIHARAVQGNPSFMPPAPSPQLSAADKAKITNWVNAGGGIGN